MTEFGLSQLQLENKKVRKKSYSRQANIRGAISVYYYLSPTS